MYWYDGKVYTGAGSVVSTAPGGSGAETSVTLYKVGGGTAALDISTAAANGNPLVKSYSFDEVKTKMNKKEILNGLTLIALQWFFLNIERT
mgnify:CR=1 FL=1